MNLFSFIAGITAPTDLWTKLIQWIHGSVFNFGWTIIIVTILVKFITTPLEFAVKLNSKKQMLIQQKCSTQVAKLQKKFGSDKQRLQVQTNALYKREGLNMGTGCIIMLVNLILSFTIFMTFYSSLRKVSAYEAIHQYEQINEEYVSAFYKEVATVSSTYFTTPEEAKAWNESTEEDKVAEQNAFWEAHQELKKSATEKASKATIEKWNEIKPDSTWLWIQNIWVSDSTANPFPYYDSLKSNAKNTGYLDYVTENIKKEDYNKLATLINNNAPRQANGFYILAILAGVITFLSQYISELHNKLKNKKANKLAKTASNATGAGASMKYMKIIMPIIMVLFVLSASASFGLYLLASNISSIVFGEITTLIINQITKKKRLEVEESLAKEAERLIKKGRMEE